MERRDSDFLTSTPPKHNRLEHYNIGNLLYRLKIACVALQHLPKGLTAAKGAVVISHVSTGTDILYCYSDCYVADNYVGSVNGSSV